MRIPYTEYAGYLGRQRKVGTYHWSLWPPKLRYIRGPSLSCQPCQRRAQLYTTWWCTCCRRTTPKQFHILFVSHTPLLPWISPIYTLDIALPTLRCSQPHRRVCTIHPSRDLGICLCNLSFRGPQMLSPFLQFPPTQPITNQKNCFHTCITLGKYQSTARLPSGRPNLRRGSTIPSCSRPAASNW